MQQRHHQYHLFMTVIAVLSGLLVGNRASFAMSKDEARRYGYSKTIVNDPALATKKPATGDPFSPEQIPSPVLTPLSPRATGVPKPRSHDGSRLSPLPQIVPKGPGHQLPKLPPPPPAIDLSYKRVGDATCLGCHQGYGKDPKRGHLTLLRNAAHFKAPRDKQAWREYRQKLHRHRRNRRRRARAGAPGVRRDNAPKPPPTKAAKAGCESCHGPGSRHAVSKSKRHIFNFKSAPYGEANGICLGCHYMQKRLDAHSWRFSGHAAGRVKCVDCHSEHAVQRPPMLKSRPNQLCLSCHKDVERTFMLRSHHPVKDERFQQLRGSLQRSKLRCTDCHDPHRRRDDRRSIRRGRNEGCVRCHPATRGPFRYEHRVSFTGKAACQECHLPHGSPNRKLLVATGRPLCLRCHPNLVTHNVGQSCYSAGCHPKVHGSNRSLLLRR